MEDKIRKFTGYGLHIKFFLLGLFISLNSVDRMQIESSRILCLAVLPLVMISASDLKVQPGDRPVSETFKDHVEKKLAARGPTGIRELIDFDSKVFYRFVKEILKEQDDYNLKNHFEKYFSMSGFLRDLLNEIIKLQQQQESQLKPGSSVSQ